MEILNVISNFILMAISAILFENVIFTRALGSSRMIFEIKNIKDSFVVGAILTIITTLSCVLSYPINYFLYSSPIYLYLRPIVFLTCIIIIYAGIMFLLYKKYPKLFEHLKVSIEYCAFNCIVLGTVFTVTSQKFTFFETLGFGLGVGIGFMLAIFLIYIGRKRLELCNIPKVFRGLPILLIYIGIVSLAVYGLIGHGLPT